MKLLIILFFFIPTLLFGQLTKENDSTYILRMNKQQMDKFFTKMVQYDINDSLLQLEKSDNADLKKLVAVKDSIIKKDSLIIEKKDAELTNAQTWIDKEMSNKVDFWQGLNCGLRAETHQEINWQQIESKSFNYSLFFDIGIRIGKIDLNPGINLYLNGQKPTYFLTAKYRIF
jgi:hypothetical protein